MSTILACTDGSIYAPSVYQHAAWAATQMRARVEVLHVIDPHRERSQTHDLSGAIGFNASEELTEELTKLEEVQGRLARLKGKAILDDARARLVEAGVTDISETQRHGTLVDTLDEFEPGCDLVVIGKRGEAADFAKGHLGSNLQRVIRASIRPVLVTSRTFKPIRRFLIAFDGGASARKAVAYAAEQPLLKGLECHLLMAGRPGDHGETALHEARDRLAAAGFQVTAESASGSAEEVIGNAVKNSEIDLLVMGAYGHSPIRHLVLGSTTTTMVRTCLVPVLMFR